MTDLDYLLKLRLVVARYGEMDVAGWWNTRGLLGRQGKVVLQRGFPQTHYFAQAQVLFAVARGRCEAVFSAPASITLWSLPGELEDRFDSRWSHWLDHRADWEPFFERLEQVGSDDLTATLQSFGLVDEGMVQATETLRRSAQGNAVQLPAAMQLGDEMLGMLAAGFARGEHGKLAVPYAYIEEGGR